MKQEEFKNPFKGEDEIHSSFDCIVANPDILTIGIVIHFCFMNVIGRKPILENV